MGTTANPNPDDGVEPDAGDEQPGTGSGTGSEQNPNGSGASPLSPAQFDRTKLNPVLRSLDEEELNQVFDTLLQTVRQGPSNQPQSVQAPIAPPEPEPDYKELLDPNSEQFNPQAAFQGFVKKNYGTLLGDINQRSLDSVFLNMAQQFPDFREHEGDIRNILKQRDPLSLTQMDVLGTYYAVKGAKVTNEQLKQKRTAAAASTVTPTPSAPKEHQPEIQISAVEQQIAARMFPRAKDPVAEYKKYLKSDREGFEMKVPIGGGKFA